MEQVGGYAVVADGACTLRRTQTSLYITESRNILEGKLDTANVNCLLSPETGVNVLLGLDWASIFDLTEMA